MELDHGEKESDCAGSSRTWRIARHGGLYIAMSLDRHTKKEPNKEEHVWTKLIPIKSPKTRWQGASMPVFFRGKCQLVSWATQSSAA